MRGYFEIGIYRPKTPLNLGTLWRSAYQLGAAGIFVISQRWPERQASDTLKSWKHVPLRRYENFDTFLDAMPFGCPLVGVEMGGKPVERFTHPERAIYLLGAEDGGLPNEVQARCHHLVSLTSLRTNSFNVSVAGSIVMYDRMVKA